MKYSLRQSGIESVTQQMNNNPSLSDAVQHRYSTGCHGEVYWRECWRNNSCFAFEASTPRQMAIILVSHKLISICLPHFLIGKSCKCYAKSIHAVSVRYARHTSLRTKQSSKNLFALPQNKNALQSCTTIFCVDLRQNIFSDAMYKSDANLRRTIAKYI